MTDLATSVVETTLPQSEELILRAKAMVPALRERANACEAQRQVPGATFEEMRAAGLFNVCKPKAYGGYEMDWDVLCEICMELAKGCGSSAWVYAVLAEHNQTVGTYPLQAQEDVWGEKTDTFIASGNSPNSVLKPVDGGFRVTTQFNYSSGCDFADWHLTGMPIDGRPTKVLMPQKDCEIVDNWHVLGLNGTGSKDVKMVDVFIPYHRTIPIGERGPRFNGAPIFRQPQWSVNPFDLAAVCVGVAEGALDRFTDQMKERANRFGTKIAEFQSLQLRIAESAAELRAARIIILDTVRETMGILRDQEELSKETMARNQRDMAFAPNLAIRAIDRIFYAAGANGLFLSNDLQRCWRDVHAGSRQIALNWDIAGTLYGKVFLGLELGRVRW